MVSATPSGIDKTPAKMENEMNDEGKGEVGLSAAQRDQYWQKNLKLLSVLLAIWASVSFGAGILFVDQLNQFNLPGTGFPLGFWFAQQGAIVTFVVLIVVYAVLMNRIDREFGVDEDG